MFFSNKTKTGLSPLLLSAGAAWALLAAPAAAALEEAGPQRPAECRRAEAVAPFLGLPFRADGALNADGQWVTFTQPEKALRTPGFNCSGFAVAAAARLAGRNFDLTAVSRDRRGDSGPGAALGQDWDFGLDLILNLTENLPRRFLPPIDEAPAPPLFVYAPRLATGLGIDLHSPIFEKYLHELQPGRFAFFVFSKPDRRFPAGVSYYHVGLIIPESPEAIWLYHSTAGARTHRFNLAAAGDLARLRRYFPPTKSGERRVLMVEVAPEDGCL